MLTGPILDKRLLRSISAGRCRAKRSSATATLAGQPNKGSPWNYNGSESVSNYQANVLDWILASLRAGLPSVDSTVFRTAALLRSNGQVPLAGSPPTLASMQSYYVVIEHPNHLGVMSHVPILVQDGTLPYDFTAQDSYTNINPISIGQKQIGTVFAMHCCDGNKKLPDEDSLINASDYLLWLNINGAFGLYSGADFGMDAQISAFVKLVWTSNNGKFSLIGRQ